MAAVLAAGPGCRAEAGVSVPRLLLAAAGLDEVTAKFLQETAWETVQEYYGK